MTHGPSVRRADTSPTCVGEAVRRCHGIRSPREPSPRPSGRKEERIPDRRQRPHCFWSKQGSQENARIPAGADRPPIDEGSFDGCDPVENFQSDHQLGRVVVGIMSRFLSVDERPSDVLQSGVDGRAYQRRCTRHQLSSGELLADLLHLAMRKCSPDSRAKAGDIARGEGPCAVGDKKMEQRVVGCGHRPAQTGLPRPVGLLGRQIPRLLEQVVVQRHGVVSSTWNECGCRANAAEA